MSDTTGKDERNETSPTFWVRHTGRILGVSALIVLAIGTAVYHLLEGWSWVDSFYFSSVAASTVGFGDLTPSTDTCKLFTVFYIFAGITIITVWLNSRFKRRARSVAQKKHFEPASDALDGPMAGPRDEAEDPGAARSSPS